MNLLRLPLDAPEAVRKQRKRLLILLVLAATAAAAAAIRFIVGLRDPFAGISLRTNHPQGRVAAEAPAVPRPANSQVPEARAPVRETPSHPRQSESPPLQEAEPSAIPPSDLVFVQLAAFRERARAISLAHRATRAGFPSSATPSTMADGTLIYRVRIDQALDPQSAAQLVRLLRTRLPDLRPIRVRNETER
jgi:cell division septation protein DedD